MKTIKIILTLLLLLITVRNVDSAGIMNDSPLMFLDEVVVVAYPILSTDELITRIKNMKTSDCGKEFIQNHEGYRDTAYTIGDGMITIGYGHAEKYYRSKYRIGDKITYSTALKLFNEDIWEAEQGVKRILLDKICRNDLDIYITQGMFDALVSMAYNMGVYGLATTDFIAKLALSDHPLESAEMIKSTRIRGWRGLKKRREAEYNLFVSDNIIS